MASTVDSKRVAERFDTPDELEAKLDKLAALMKASTYTVFFTGAGVSTSAGVRDYRGPSGAWTQRRIKELRTTAPASEADARELVKLLAEREKEGAKAAAPVPTTDAQPTYCHMAMASLIRERVAHYVVTTNLDGIFRKAGLRGHTELCCLHGDMYVERCTGCGHDFERNYHVRQKGVHVHDHAVGRCRKCGSKPPAGYTGKKAAGRATGSGTTFKRNGLIGTEESGVGTKDTHINFGENLDDADWNEADEHCRKADLCIVMGTSMSLRHITHFPFEATKTVICNLQATPDDKKADLRVWAKCDDIMEGVCERLGVDVAAPQPWLPADPLSVSELKKRGVSTGYIAAAERLMKLATERVK